MKKAYIIKWRKNIGFYTFNMLFHIKTRLPLKYGLNIGLQLSYFEIILWTLELSSDS